MARKVMGFKEAVEYVYLNDGDAVEIMDDGEVVLSVAASMVADIFDRTNEEMLKELRKYFT